MSGRDANCHPHLTYLSFSSTSTARATASAATDFFSTRTLILLPERFDSSLLDAPLSELLTA
jgi:hypothetical protein